MRKTMSDIPYFELCDTCRRLYGNGRLLNAKKTNTGNLPVVRIMIGCRRCRDKYGLDAMTIEESGATVHKLITGQQ